MKTIMSKIIDLTNKRFGRLTSLRLVGRVPSSGHMLWECRCDCGNYKKVSSNALNRGTTTSCGCYALELFNKSFHKPKHQLSRTRAYNTWAQMKQRCTNPKHKSYEHYGKKGITYIEKWETFDGFWEDMKDGYSEGLTLDRMDNAKGYSKENCRWATASEQANIKSNNILITINGVTDTIANTARKHGISPELALFRLKQKKTIEETFLTPPRSRKQKK